MILSFCILLLFIFYTSGGFKKLMDFYRSPEPEPEPAPEPVTVETITKPEPKPEPIPEPEPTPEPVKPEPIPETEPPKMDRKKLEQTARNCLTAAGCTFDTWSYCRFKSDIELMDIIKEYNLNK